jgi:chloramphenicol 3-O-phosphotransferase
MAASRAGPIFVLSGEIGAGKSELAIHFAAARAYMHLRVRELLRERVADKGPATRENLQRWGAQIERESRGQWLADLVLEIDQDTRSRPGLVIDAVRTTAQVDRLRERFQARIYHIHLTASRENLERRFENRRQLLPGETTTYAEALAHEIGGQQDALRAVADFVVDTSTLTTLAVYERVVATLPW